jgi:hypothetical protein
VKDGGGDIPGIRLTKNDLQKAADEAREQFPHIIIRIIRVNELNKYYPLYDDRSAARRELRDALYDQKLAELVISRYSIEEQNNYMRDGAEDDKTLERLLEPVRKFYRAVLIAEMPKEIASEIWQRAGSWSAAMTLARHEPLSPKKKLEAQTYYAATNASVEHLPGKMLNKLSPGSLEQLNQLCELARELRRPPQPHELPEKFLKNLKNRLYAEGCAPNTLLKRAGIDYFR